jgi:hypothetical protein
MRGLLSKRTTEKNTPETKWSGLLLFKARSKRFILVTIALLMLVSTFGGLVNALPAHAAVAGDCAAGGNYVPQNGNPCTPNDEATSYSYYQMLSGCVGGNMFGDFNVTVQQNGEAKTTDMFDDNTANGFVYPIGASTQCSTVMKKALSLWGWSSTATFLKAMKYTYLPNVSTGKPTYHGTPDGPTRRLDFQKAVKDQVYGGKTPTLSDAAVYDIDLNAFTSTSGPCNATDLGAYTSLNATEKKYVDEGTVSYSGPARGKTTTTYVKIPVVNAAAATSADHGYSYAVTIIANSGDSTAGIATLYGYHVNPTTRSCADLIKGIQQYAGALKAWALLNVGTTDAAPTFNPASDPKSSCSVDGIGWIICPVVNFLAGVADSAFGFLANNFLKTNTALLDTSDANGTYTAWKYMRTIANVAFVIAFLIIIFSQLTGVGVSNYGVKKLLPRIVVAAILVNVSFFISQIAVDISNILGFSIKDLFNSIVTSIDKTTTQLDTTSVNSALASNPVGNTATGEGFAGLTLTVLAVAAGVGGYALLSTLIPVILAAVIALVMILFILVARQAIVVLLIVVSPLAFVAFLLPNTQGLFKQWRKMLTSMLLLFPIIALVFGASTLASHILSGTFNNSVTGDDANVFGQIIASAILVLPLFAVPVLLKKSLEGIPVLGQMATKFAGRANGNLNKRLGESYKGSLVGRGLAYRKAGAEAYRSGRFAKRVNDGGLAGKLAGGIAILPAARAGQKSLVKSAVQTSEKAEIEEITAAETLLRTQNPDPTELIAKAKLSLTTSITKKDSVGARAAQNILLNSGGAGLRELQDTLSKSFPDVASQSNEVGDSLRTALNRAGLKSKNSALASWAFNGESLGATEKQAKTYGNLSDVEIGGQSEFNLRQAFSTGVLTPDRAKEILKNPVVASNLGPAEKLFIQQVSQSPGFVGPRTKADTPDANAVEAEVLDIPKDPPTAP